MAKSVLYIDYGKIGQIWPPILTMEKLAKSGQLLNLNTETKININENVLKFYYNCTIYSTIYCTI